MRDHAPVGIEPDDPVTSRVDIRMLELAAYLFGRFAPLGVVTFGHRGEQLGDCLGVVHPCLAPGESDAVTVAERG